MTEYIYSSSSDGTQRPSVKANATGSPIALGAAGASLLGAHSGTATLVAGTKVVSDTSITANSIIILTGQNLGTVTAPKALCVSARSNGTSFTILSADNTDTSKVAYLVIN